MVESLIFENLTGAMTLLILGLLWGFFWQNQRYGKALSKGHQETVVRRQMFEAMNDLVFICDSKGMITDCNRKFSQFHQINMNDIKAGTLDLDHLLPQLSGNQATNEVTTGLTCKKNEHWISSAEGTPVLMEFIKVPVRDDSGHLVGVIGVGRDKTRQWNLDQAHKDMASKLVETNQDLAEALELARELSGKADEANRAKSDFLANMSHEIRTPLGAIIGLSDLALQTDLDAQQAGYMTKLDKAAHSLLDIINNILDFSKIEAGKMATEEIPFSLDEILYQVTDMFEDRVMARNLYFIRKQQDIPNYLVGDPTQLRQILVNLLGNAIKFTEEGGITLSVKSRARYKDKTFLVFSIADTGIGIPEDKFENLFSSFSQVDTTTSRRFGGTGLGLALCQKLVDLMGGNIWVESEEGKGSKFCFALPFREQTDQQRQEFQEMEIATANRISTAPGIPLSGYRVLLVDDNEFNQEVFSEILTQKGAQVTLATNGKEAVARVKQNTYDVVLMDMQMPVMNGLEATEIIRNQLGLNELPIIALTANATENDRRACMDSGMDDHLTKPINPPELVAAILKNAEIEQPIQAPVSDEKIDIRQNSIPHSMAKHEDPRVPGIDIKEVMDRIGGKKDLLARLLKMFLDQHANDPAKINMALAEDDREKAIEITHALKGTSGNLSAFNIFKESSDFEMKLRDTAAPLAMEIPPSLAASMETAMKSMEILLHNINTQNQSTRPSETLSAQEVEAKLKFLKAMIENNDIRAEELFLELKSSLAKMTSHENLDLLENSISVFNFATAKETLEKIQTDLTSNQP